MGWLGLVVWGVCVCYCIKKQTKQKNPFHMSQSIIALDICLFRQLCYEANNVHVILKNVKCNMLKSHLKYVDHM